MKTSLKVRQNLLGTSLTLIPLFTRHKINKNSLQYDAYRPLFTVQGVSLSRVVSVGGWGSLSRGVVSVGEGVLSEGGCGCGWWMQDLVGGGRGLQLLRPKVADISGGSRIFHRGCANSQNWCVKLASVSVSVSVSVI